MSSGGDGRNHEKTCRRGCCTLLVSLGFFVLIYWAIFQPHQIRARVDYAELSNLTISNTSSSSSSTTVTVSYHVAMNLSLYNPSKRVNIYYDTLHAELRYRGVVLSPSPAAATAVSPGEFYQRRKSEHTVSLVFDGNGVAVSGSDGNTVGKQLEGEVKTGHTLGLELSVDARVRYVFGIVKIRQKPRVWCALSVPVPSTPGDVGVLASGDRCWVKYRR